MIMTIELTKDLLTRCNNKTPYLIDGKHLKKTYREIITFKDGTKIKVVYK